MKKMNFFDELIDIIKLYKDGNEDALDGDEVDKLTEHLRNQINLIEGNITNDEFDKLENE